MKATLEFNLPEEKKEFEQAALSQNMAIVLFEIIHNAAFNCKTKKQLLERINDLAEQYNIHEII